MSVMFSKLARIMRSRILKKFWIIPFFVFILWPLYRVIFYPSLTKALPYKIEIDEKVEIVKLFPNKEIDILVLGDQMGISLYKYAEKLSDLLSYESATPINIGLLAKKRDGLHRSLAKLKKLKKLPTIVLYHGSSQEEWELKFKTIDSKRIYKNLTEGLSPFYQSLLYVSPFFGKFIFSRFEIQNLNSTPKEVDPNLADKFILQRMPVNYLLFYYELLELIDYVQSSGSLLILITTPIDNSIKPLKTCEQSFTSTLKENIEQSEQYIENGNYITAYNKLKDLMKEAHGNALAHYLFGVAASKTGQIKESIHHLMMASSLDCRRWRSNAVYNTIIRDLAKDKEVPLFDFAAIFLKQWHFNSAFLKGIYPQELFYQKAVKILGMKLKDLLQL
jgi:hypothetical protein